MLILSAYDATEWKLQVAKGVKLTRILVLGYNKQTLTGAPRAPQAESFSGMEGSHEGYVSMGNNRDDRLDMIDRIAELTGKFPETVQGGHSFTEIVVDGSRTEPMPKQDNIGVPPGTDVVFVAPGPREIRSEITDGGLSARYPCQGGSTKYFASRGHQTGKVYWELKGKFIGGRPETGTRAGTGLWRGGFSDLGFDALDRDFRRNMSDGDVVGFAMDLDTGHLYWHVNGKWANAEPESNAGKRLKPGHAYFAVVNVAPHCNALGRADTWTANFGKTKFSFGIPKGYKSYDGRQGG